jgi:DNA-binding transcriptional LysR family regulator
MDWRSVSFDWNQVRAFLATVEEGSLSAAARALGLTQPTLGRQVAGLEAALGLTLFERIGKTLVLTGPGMELLDHVRAMGDAANRISLTATGQSQTIEGHVRLSVSDSYAAYILPPIVARLARTAPGIILEVVVSNALSDLRRREADIAIRHVRPTEPDLIARLIRTDHARLYAAPGYIRRHGLPASLADTQDALFIGVDRSPAMIDYLAAHGLTLTPRNFRFFCENIVVGWEMVKQGLAIGVMSEDIADRTEGVARILPEFAPIPVPIWLTTHRELHTSARIRLVYDLLADALR